jgi:3-oxoadipate enol-lactonase
LEARVPIAHVNGIDINYQLDGSGDNTLVLINGLADALDSWDFQVPAFVAAGFRVLRFDNRGIGQSDAPAGLYTARQLADDTKALVDDLGITNHHVLGVSMGGMIAQEYALAHGRTLRSLTLACTYAAPGPFCSRMFRMWADLARTVGLSAVMRDVGLWAFTVPFFEEREAEALEFESALAALTMSLEAYLAQLNVIQTHDTVERLGSIATPTLVLAGEDDILIPVRLSERLRDGIPNAAWALVPGGHACLWEHPDPFNAAIVDFGLSHL